MLNTQSPEGFRPNNVASSDLVSKNLRALNALGRYMRLEGIGDMQSLIRNAIRDGVKLGLKAPESRNRNPLLERLQWDGYVYGCDEDKLKFGIPTLGIEVDVTNLEAKIVRALMVAEGTPVTRQVILSEMDGEREYHSRAADIHITRIRKKLGSKNPKEYIKTLRGIGYRLSPVSHVN